MIFFLAIQLIEIVKLLKLDRVKMSLRQSTIENKNTNREHKVDINKTEVIKQTFLIVQHFIKVQIYWIEMS